MNGLVPFGLVDIDDEETSLDAIEAAEFLQKMDSEGGITSMFGWGGTECFPEPIRAQAELAEAAIEELREAIKEWAAERGVEA